MLGAVSAAYERVRVPDGADDLMLVADDFISRSLGNTRALDYGFGHDDDGQLTFAMRRTYTIAETVDGSYLVLDRKQYKTGITKLNVIGNLAVGDHAERPFNLYLEVEGTQAQRARLSYEAGKISMHEITEKLSEAYSVQTDRMVGEFEPIIRDSYPADPNNGIRAVN